MKLKGFRFLLFLIFCPAIFALTYNGNPSNYRSLLTQLRPGDTLVLASGNYNLLPITGVRGTFAAWITITGPASGPPAVIQGNVCCNAVEILNSSYLAIKNLTVDSMGLDSDGINAHSGLSNLTHDILIEGNTLINQGATQQTVGISTKTPTWGWIIRRNTIIGAGTGIYLGNSDGTMPFIGGLIENNVVKDAIGYDLQIKFQTARPTTIAGMPTGQSVTVIRNNVFTKNDQPSPDGERPNVVVEAFPDTGPGSNDMYEIYGNFFYHNPLEALLQCSGQVSVHDNVFANGQYAAAVFQAHNGPLKVAYVYNNTVYSSAQGITFGTAATVDDAVLGNLVFAANPISGSIAHASGNIVGPLASATTYLNNPSFVLGSMDFYPRPNNLTLGTSISLSKFSSDLDYFYDFNGVSKGLTGYVYRGAYSGQGVNPGWMVQAAIKPLNAAATPLLNSVQCQPTTVASGQTSTCTVVLTSAAPVATTVSLSYAGPVSGATGVTIPAGAASMPFTVATAAVSSQQTATVTGTLNGTARSDTLTVNQSATLPGVASVVCNPLTLTAGASSNCTVNLTAPVASTTTVAITSSSSSLTAAAAITIAAGSSSGPVAATAGTVPSTQTVQLTATLNGTSTAATLTINPTPPPIPGVTSVSCNPLTLTAGASTNCTVTLSAAVSSATTVAISLSSTILMAPGSITINGGAATGSVTATAGSPATTQTVQLRAALNSTSAAATLTVNPAPTPTSFYLNGNSTEMASLTPGAPVVPTTAPPGLTGSLVKRGTGSVAFSPIINGGGVVFAKPGVQNTNTAFVNFSGGSAIGSVFNSHHGDLTFYLRSSHSFAERLAMAAPSLVFDVGDGVTQRLFFFDVYAQSGRLLFAYGVGGDAGFSYTVPAGMEDQILAKDAIAKFRLYWDGSRATLFINDQPVAASSYVPLDANWNSSASFALGSTSLLFWGGGYYTCDDLIAGFQMR